VPVVAAVAGFVAFVEHGIHLPNILKTVKV
jgi:hypothetical protein